MIITDTLQRAHAILAGIQHRERDEDVPEYLLCVSTFRNNKISGLSVSNDNAQRRVNLLGHPVNDGYRVVYGDCMDFDFDTGQATDQARYRDFAFDQLDQAAQFALDFLMGKF